LADHFKTRALGLAGWLLLVVPELGLEEAEELLLFLPPQEVVVKTAAKQSAIAKTLFMLFISFSFLI
jgi:hypothetical protein